jgi:single-strand DNA-binding protein
MLEAAVIGTVGAPPELKVSAAGKHWAQFSIGVEFPAKSPDAKPRLEWVRICTFGETAERAASTFAKGSRVYVEGRLSLDNWVGADGVQRFGASLSAFKAELLGAAAIGRNRERASQC